jgi:hypothetical protein
VADGPRPARRFRRPRPYHPAFPFAPPPLISTTILDRLGELLTAVDAFSYNLIQTGWFGDTVLWLAPDPPDPFRSLTSASVTHLLITRPTAVGSANPFRT